MHMDLSNPNNLIGLSTPVQMPVSELLTGNYHFTIPSYQRGYRWESGCCQQTDNEPKQVDDLLNDLLDFVKGNVNQSPANYYLQPLMVKPKYSTQNGDFRNTNGVWEWEVLDGQQRLTTMLLILKCLNERLCNGKYSPYTIRYEIRQGLDLGKITYDEKSPYYDYPSLKDNQDCYYIRKAKNRIKEWYDNEIANNQPIQDSLKAALFYPDSSRGDQYPTPKLRAIFIWYNVEPSTSTTQSQSKTRLEDIAVFNRLNRGKISLTDSELIKALFILSLKKYPYAGSSLTADTLVRKWDEMGRKFQDDSLWETISPKGKEYQNRLDLLFDFIRESDEASKKESSYRYYHNKLNAQGMDIQKLEKIWEEIKRHFDKICKWHEDVSCHNFIGYLVECGKSISTINKEIVNGINNNIPTIATLKKMVNDTLSYADNKYVLDSLDDLNYRDHYDAIKRTLLLFNVLTCDKHGQKFPFDCYNKHQYDIEHINSQTDNPIEKIDEKIEWIKSQALLCLNEDYDREQDENAYALIKEGTELLNDLNDTLEDKGSKFKTFRAKVEEYYAGNNGNANRDSIGNLTLLNSSINREYKNALYPSKLKTLKLCDQEGVYIPLCTKYLFMKYYTNTSNTTSAFNMTRWREDDQTDYVEAIEFTLKNALK